MQKKHHRGKKRGLILNSNWRSTTAASRSSKSELILLQNACGEKTQEKGGSNFSQDRFLFYASTKLLLRREGGLSSYEIPLISPGKIRSTASAEKFKLGRRDPWTKEN